MTDWDPSNSNRRRQSYYAQNVKGLKRWDLNLRDFVTDDSNHDDKIPVI